MRAIGYCRVSTEGQANEGVSLDAQAAGIRAWAELHGHELVNIYTDAGISGCDMRNRPAFQAAVDETCRIKGALVVYKLDRFARSVSDAYATQRRITDAGAALLSLTESDFDSTTANGKFMFGIHAILNQRERDIISERTKAALAFKKSKGERVGTLPFGYTVGPDGKQLVPEPSEQKVLALLGELKAKGYSYRRIASELNEQGYRTRRGGRWSCNGVFNLAA